MTDSNLTIETGNYGRFTVQRVTLKGGEAGYSVAFPYDGREVHRIRKMGGRWLQGSKVWFMPAAKQAVFAEYLAVETRSL